MYEIRPESNKTFLTDRNVRLPRFQRKQTWDDKKNFQLCISLFKEYPIGVCILSIDEGRGRTIRWLLDGRQRRNALQLMYEDPENIYKWGKKFIGFKNNDQPSDIETKFYAKINEYIEEDADEEERQNDLEEDTVVGEDDTTELLDSNEPDEKIKRETYGLDLLLDIIKIIHNQNKKTTGFTRPFDFTKYVKRLPYVENVQGVEKLSSKEVKSFIDDYQKYCDSKGLPVEDSRSFYSFLSPKYEITDENKLKEEIRKQWGAIKERILIVEKIDNLLSTSKIGMIEVRNLKLADSQKIFHIINSEGEKLTAVEILSAKPHWNNPVENPSQLAIDAVRELYTRIGTVQDSVVRWDLPATFIKRLGKNFIFKNFTDSKTDFAKEVTLGFKVLAGLYDKGVKKENIERLGKKDLNWSIDIDQLINDMQSMLKLIGSFTYFKFFKSWRTSLMEISSDAIALDFLLLSYMDWKRKGRPLGDTQAKVFQKNCFILWDRLLYEYIYKQWRGSADQKIANNIDSFPNENEKFDPISEEKWMKVLDQVFEESAIEGADISQALMKPLLYHMYCLKSISGPDTNYDIEVDHIIPQSLFERSSIPRAEVVQHNLLNLGLLPKDENVSKGNKRLIEITDKWLIQQILHYEFIDNSDYQKFSDINNYRDMFDQRKTVFVLAFGSGRKDMINNN